MCEDKCIICMDNVVKARTILECGHIYCTRCILRWFSEGKNRCPCCLKEVDGCNLSDISKENNELRRKVGIYAEQVSVLLSALGRKCGELL